MFLTYVINIFGYTSNILHCILVHMCSTSELEIFFKKVLRKFGTEIMKNHEKTKRELVIVY